MFNLLVASVPGTWDRVGIDWDEDRFLTMTRQYVRDHITSEVRDLATALKRLPTLLAYEQHLNLPARFAWIKSIKITPKHIVCQFSREMSINPIPAEALGRMAKDLGIGQSELSTRHWAVKDADLPEILVKYRRLTKYARVHDDFWKKLKAATQIVQPPSTELVGSSKTTPMPDNANVVETIRNRTSESAATREGAMRKPRIFIVHGHDDGFLNEVARFIEKMGMEAVILREQPSKGNTIIAKFKEHADTSDYAVVLMTPDDQGRAKAEKKSHPRARQNVVFELGFFYGALGAGRVAALTKGSVQVPSDFDGVVYIDASSETWKVGLIRELNAAKVQGDYNAGMGF